MAMFTGRLPVEGAVLGVGNDLQMVRVPAGVDPAAVMQLHPFGNGAAEQLPAEPMGVAVLRLGDAAVGGGRPREPPTGAQFRMGRPEFGTVDQAFQFRPTRSGPVPALA